MTTNPFVTEDEDAAAGAILDRLQAAHRTLTVEAAGIHATLDELNRLARVVEDRRRQIGAGEDYFEDFAGTAFAEAQHVAIDIAELGGRVWDRIATTDVS